MHADEVETNEPLVRRLLNAQFPAWAELPIKRVVSAGTDNALYRLGSNMVVRLPRIHWAVDAVEKEQRWLPLISRHLPRRVWDAALEAHEWDGRPTWVHSDLDPGNVLIRSGRISAVIDWGSLHMATQHET